MNRTEFRFAIGLLILALLAGIGFFFMFEKINALETTLKNFELQGAIGGQSQATSTPGAATSSDSTIPSSTASSSVSGLKKIQTAIIVLALSDPRLQPQTALTVSIEDVTRAPDGTLTVAMKAFANAATAYSAFDPASVVSIISLEDGKTTTGTASGSFGSIPPKSSALGAITFKTDPTAATLVLQIGSGDSTKYYEFDFSNLTYRETIIG